MQISAALNTRDHGSDPVIFGRGGVRGHKVRVTKIDAILGCALINDAISSDIQKNDAILVRDTKNDAILVRDTKKRCNISARH
jgi:hypothetical protein